MRALAAAAFIAMALPAGAQEVSECDWRTDMRFIAEPWETSTRTFANGAVRLVLLDTYEPAMLPFQIAVISPPLDELGWPQCMAIGAFHEIDFAALAAAYDPAVGLIFSVPVRLYDSMTDSTPNARLGFSLNQATGAIALRVERAGP
jgi:hypothetical protein